MKLDTSHLQEQLNKKPTVLSAVADVTKENLKKNADQLQQRMYHAPLNASQDTDPDIKRTADTIKLYGTPVAAMAATVMSATAIELTADNYSRHGEDLKTHYFYNSAEENRPQPPVTDGNETLPAPTQDNGSSHNSYSAPGSYEAPITTPSEGVSPVSAESNPLSQDSSIPAPTQTESYSTPIDYRSGASEPIHTDSYTAPVDYDSSIPSPTQSTSPAPGPSSFNPQSPVGSQQAAIFSEQKFDGGESQSAIFDGQGNGTSPITDHKPNGSGSNLPVATGDGSPVVSSGVSSPIPAPPSGTGSYGHNPLNNEMPGMGGRPQSIMEEAIAPMMDKNAKVVEDNSGHFFTTRHIEPCAEPDVQQFQGGITGLDKSESYVDTPLDTSLNNMGGNRSLDPSVTVRVADQQMGGVNGSNWIYDESSRASGTALGPVGGSTYYFTTKTGQKPGIMEERVVHFRDVSGNEISGIIDPVKMKSQLENVSNKTRREIESGHFVREFNRATPMSLGGDTVEQQFFSYKNLQARPLDLDRLRSRGWRVIKAKDGTGQDVGFIIERVTHSEGVGAMSQSEILNQVGKDMKVFEMYKATHLSQPKGIKGKMIAFIVPKTTREKLEVAFKRDPVAREMLRQEARGRNVLMAGKLKKKAIRQLKASVVNYMLQNMSKDESFAASYTQMRRYLGAAKFAGRQTIGLFNGVVNYHLKKMGIEGGIKGLKKRLRNKVLNSFKKKLADKISSIAVKKLTGRIHKEALKGVLKLINAQIAAGSVNGLIAMGIWKGLTGAAGILVKGSTSVIRKIPGVGGAKVINKVLDAATGSIPRAHGMASYREFKKASKRKASAQMRKDIRKLGSRINGAIAKRFGSRAAGNVGRITGKLTQTIGKAVQRVMAIFQKMGEHIINMFQMVSHIVMAFLVVCIALLVLGECEEALLSALTPFAGLTNVAKNSNDEGKFVPQTVTSGADDDGPVQPDVTSLIYYLREDHNKFKKKVDKACSTRHGGYPTVPTPEYDNGTKENYKECISALVCMESPNYGKYGEKIVHKALTSVYDESHVMTIVPTEFTGTRPVKNDDGTTSWETYTYIKNVVHVNVLRDDQVVDDGEFASATGTGYSDVDLPNDAWLKICAKTKKDFASQIGYYQSPGRKNIKIDGTTRNVGTDCSGYVAACLSRAGIVEWGWWRKSTEYRNSAPFYTVHKYVSRGDLEPGDILVFTGHGRHHVEIFAGISGGVVKVYNNGSDTSARNPGKTNDNKLSGLTYFCRLNTKDRDKLDEKDDDSDSKKDDSSNEDDEDKEDDSQEDTKSTYKKTKNNDPDATLDYDTASMALSKGMSFKAKGGWTGKYYGAVTYESPVGSKWDYFKTSIGNRKYLFTRSNRSSWGGLYVVAKEGQIKGMPAGTKIWIIAMGPGMFDRGGTGNGMVGQLVELKLSDGSTTFCVIGDVKSASDSTIQVPEHYCHVQGNPGSRYVSFFEGIGYYSSNQDAERTIYGGSPKGSRYVKKVIAYNKNIVPGNGLFNGKHNGSGGSVTLEPGSVYGGNEGYYNTIQWDKDGDEVGGKTAFAKTMEDYYKKSQSGEFKMTTAYGKPDDDYKSYELRHTISAKGGKGTGLDFLRRAYAEHGVTLPTIYNAVKQMKEEDLKYKKTKPSWPDMKIGDIILYQIDMNKPFNRPNSAIFARVDNNRIIGYANESFTDINGTSYLKGNVVRLPFAFLRKNNIYGVYRVTGITCKKLRLAMPYVGFGGFDTKQIHLYDATKDAKDMWIEDSERLQNVKDKHFYNGYVEDDLKQSIDVSKLKKTRADEKKIEQLQYAAAYCGSQGILPSVFVTAAWMKSDFGESNLWNYRNPVGLTKWWTGDEYDYVVLENSKSKTLCFSSFRECAEAWCNYVEDTCNARTLSLLRGIASPDYELDDKYKGRFQVAINYYLSFINGQSLDDNENVYVWDKVCDTYNLYRWDGDLTGEDPVENDDTDIEDNDNDQYGKDQYDQEKADEAWNDPEHPEKYSKENTIDKGDQETNDRNVEMNRKIWGGIADKIWDTLNTPSKNSDKKTPQEMAEEAEKNANGDNAVVMP